MKLKILFIMPIISVLLTSQVLADPLVLSDAQIQKLKAYFPAQDSDSYLIWKGEPITIDLPLNKEKRIVFPTHITVDAKSALTTDQLRIINNDKSLYLTALKPLPTTRIYITLQDTKEVVLIDLVTNDKANNETTYIDIKQNNTSQTAVTAPINNLAVLNNTNKLDQVTSPTSDNDTYVTLMRFAWQQLYAPERLISNQ